MNASSAQAALALRRAAGFALPALAILWLVAGCELPRAHEALPPPLTVRVGPHASLEEVVRAAPAGARLELSAGDFSGNVVIDKPLVIAGARGFATRWLPGAGHGPLVTVRSAGVRLVNLVLERGEVGVRVEGGAALLENVSLLRQERLGLELVSGTARVVGGEILETQGGRDGFGVLARGGRLSLLRVLFRLAGHRAIELKDTRAELVDVDIAASRQTGIQALDGTTLSMVRGRVAGVLGNAVFAAASHVHLDGTILVGNEFGVLAARGATVDVEGAQIADHRVAGFALVNASGSLKRSRIERGGSEGGLSVIGAKGPVLFEDLSIVDPGANGIHLTQAKVIVRRCTISGARLDRGQDFGDGIYAIESELLLEDSTLTANAGSGITLNQSALRGVGNDLVGNARGGVIALLRSEAMLSGNRLLRNGTGLLVAERSQAQLEGNVFEGNSGLNIDACEWGSVTENLPAGRRDGGLGCGRVR